MYENAKIGGRVLFPGSIFFEECWVYLTTQEFDGRTPPLMHDEAARIGRELLLASEFCNAAEQAEISKRFHISEIDRFDIIRRYRRDVARHLRGKDKGKGKDGTSV